MADAARAAADATGAAAPAAAGGSALPALFGGFAPVGDAAEEWDADAEAAAATAATAAALLRSVYASVAAGAGAAPAPQALQDAHARVHSEEAEFLRDCETRLWELADGAALTQAMARDLTARCRAIQTQRTQLASALAAFYTAAAGAAGAAAAAPSAELAALTTAGVGGGAAGGSQQQPHSGAASEERALLRRDDSGVAWEQSSDEVDMVHADDDDANNVGARVRAAGEGLLRDGTEVADTQRAGAVVQQRREAGRGGGRARTA
jgi:hypothetical protein